jgi:uncharacterized membrane protein YccC
MLLDISVSKPLNLSLKISITFVLRISATVIAVPLGSVSGLVIPFNVSVIGNVVVASAGIAFAIRTVK